MDADQEHAQTRFRDPRGRLGQFVNFDVLVVCPQCGACAVSRPIPADSYALFWSRRLACLGCAYFDGWDSASEQARRKGVVIGGNIDPHFRLPLWLQASCCGGNTLWAWNIEHLDVLEGYLGARLRERGAVDLRGRTSMSEKLPTWMKRAKNRDELLRTIGRLRATIPPSR